MSQKLPTLLAARNLFGFCFATVLTCAVAQASTITVTFPNGGESYTGQGSGITWTDSGSNNVDIILLKNGVVTKTIVSNWPSTKNYSWTPTDPIVADTDYKIRIQATANTSNVDESDANFTIPNFVKFVYPNPMTDLARGRKQYFYWNAVGGTTVDIQLLKGGLPDSLIAQAASNSGTYQWSIPASQTLGTDYTVRVTCPAGGTAFADLPISISAPSVHVDDPNVAGISAVRGSSYYIYWSSNAPDGFKVELLKGGGSPVLLTNNNFQEFYSWSIPANQTVGNDYTIRVTSTTDASITDTSDNNFSIGDPNITVTAPNGGESFNVGDFTNITWTSNVSGPYNIDLYKGGVFYQALNTYAFYGTLFSWTIPSGLPSGSDYKIKVSSLNSPSVFDLSDANFTIISTSATVTAPNGGETLATGNFFQIKWTSPTLNSGAVDIELWDGTATKLQTIASGASNSGSYYWYVPTTLAAGSNYKIKVANDFSDAPFTIPGFLNISYPFSSQTLGSNFTHPLAWTSNAGGNVKIEVFDLNNVLVSTVSPSTANNGSYQWNDQLAAATYTMKMTVLNSTPLVSSSQYFTAAPKSVTVNNPNGGNKLALNQLYTFNWYYNTPGNVKLELIGAQNYTVAASVAPNAGQSYSSYDYTIPSSVAVGNYKLRVTNLTDGTITDDSDNTFSIENPTVTVTTPNGGEIFRRGISSYIFWNRNFTTGNVKIELVKGGVVQTPALTASTPVSSGGFYWNVPISQAVGTDYKIRITHESEATAVDDSDAVFSIAPVGYTLSAPNGGETWFQSSQHYIQWTSQPSSVSGTVNLDLYKGGVFARNIVSDIASSNSYYYWTVPGDLTPGADYKVRVTSTTDSLAFDDSDANFTIPPKLNVVKPNGGENWPRGTTQHISWDSPMDTSKRVRIELMSGSNVAYTIISTTPDSGGYDWAISPGQALGQFQVRITRLDDASITDTGDGYLTIADKSLAVYSPGGSNHIPIGYPYTIQWASNMGGQCIIELLKGGTPIAVLAQSVANPIDNKTTTFTWNVTQSPGVDYRVRITSLLDGSVIGTSSSDFAIENPTITILGPVTAAQIVAGNTPLIYWKTNFTNTYKVVLVKGGVDQATLASNLTNTAYNWAVPFNQTLDTNYAIRVSTDDNSVSATTGLFSVIPMTLSVTAPNGGEHWSIGTYHSINLSTNADGNNRVNIDLLKGGAVVQNIFSNISAASSSYGWSIPSDQTLGTDYRVRVTHAVQANLTDDSDADFSIVPRMQVLGPVGGTLAYPGTAQTISWNSGVGGNVLIELLNGTSAQTIFASTPNDNNEVWNIPANQPDGTYQIRITSLDDTTIKDTGSQFQIQQKSISVSQPYGGDFAVGYTYPISWSSNFGGNVKIELLQYDAQNNATVVQTISNSSTNKQNGNTFDTWTIPANLTTGPMFKVRISHLTDSVTALSQVFSISAPKITVTAPNGAEQYSRGNSTSIVWTANFPANVKIDLLKGANAPQSIASSVSSTQTSGNYYSWSIPVAAVAGNDYKIRVSTLDDSVTDSSDAAFSIIAHSITVSTPNGGEKYSVANSIPITWSSNFSGSNVKIELLKGGTLDTLISPSYVNTGTYYYAIPLNQAPGIDYRVRVSSVLDALGVDTSDADFEIRANQKPVANAGPDQSVKETRIGFATVALDGSASTDDGSVSPLTFSWKEGAMLLGTGAKITPELALGDHTITLTVNDGQYTATDDVVVHILANAPPVANAGPDQTVVQATSNGTDVTLSGTASTDDGSINSSLTYLWKEGATTLSTQASFTKNYAIGTHTITLTVNDGQYSASDDVVVTVTPAPNLVVDSVVGPSETYTGRSFDVTWVDKNIGNATAKGPWIDHLYLTKDGQLGTAIDLGAFAFVGNLASGESVTRIQTVKVDNSPTFQDTQYQVIVVTDGIGVLNFNNVNNLVFEGPFEDDNVTLSSKFYVHPLPLPDLIVESVTCPPTAFSGQTVTATYVVKNQGTGATDLPQWLDRLYVSIDNTPDSSDLFQTGIPNVSALAPGERYTGTVSFTIPVETAGPFHVIIRANDEGKLLETNSTNNNNSANLQINVPSTPDLQVTQFGASDNGFSGDIITLSWTVENKGPVPAVPAHGSVTDTVYLSEDTSLDISKAYALGSFTHSGNLNSGEGYSQQNVSVTLPKRISGVYNLFVFTDATNQVFEHAGEANNVVTRPISIVRSPDPDLIVQSVTPPASGSAGHAVTITWVDKNQGAGDVTNFFKDHVYLSTDQKLDDSDIEIGTLFQTSLAAGQTVTKTLSATLPTELNGDFYVIVQTDGPSGIVSQTVIEFDPGYDAEANNVTSSTTKMHVTWTAPDLQVTSVTSPVSALAATTSPSAGPSRTPAAVILSPPIGATTSIYRPHSSSTPPPQNCWAKSVTQACSIPTTLIPQVKPCIFPSINPPEIIMCLSWRIPAKASWKPGTKTTTQATQIFKSPSQTRRPT